MMWRRNGPTCGWATSSCWRPTWISTSLPVSLPRIRPVVRSITVYVADADRPLALSESVHGISAPRAGRKRCLATGGRRGDRPERSSGPKPDRAPLSRLQHRGRRGHGPAVEPAPVGRRAGKHGAGEAPISGGCNGRSENRTDRRPSVAPPIWKDRFTHGDSSNDRMQSDSGRRDRRGGRGLTWRRRRRYRRRSLDPSLGVEAVALLQDGRLVIRNGAQAFDCALGGRRPGTRSHFGDCRPAPEGGRDVVALLATLTDEDWQALVRDTLAGRAVPPVGLRGRGRHRRRGGGGQWQSRPMRSSVHARRCRRAPMPRWIRCSAMAACPIAAANWRWTHARDPAGRPPQARLRAAPRTPMGPVDMRRRQRGRVLVILSAHAAFGAAPGTSGRSGHAPDPNDLLRSARCMGRTRAVARPIDVRGFHDRAGDADLPAPRKAGRCSMPRSFAVVTISTVGYGELVPQNRRGQAVAMFYILVGLGVFVAARECRGRRPDAQARTRLERDRLMPTRPPLSQAFGLPARATRKTHAARARHVHRL